MKKKYKPYSLSSLPISLVKNKNKKVQIFVILKFKLLYMSQFRSLTIKKNNTWNSLKELVLKKQSVTDRKYEECTISNVAPISNKTELCK